MKKSLFKTLLILFSISLVFNVSAQVAINGVSDSTAILDDSFSSQVDVGYLGDAPAYELLESPAGMNISGTGEITWTPTDIASGGMVTVRSWNSGGEDTFTFNVYVSDEVICSPNLISYYNLDETNGTTFDDFIDPANQGTSLTALNDTAGPVGRAQMFKPSSKTTQYITIPDNDQMEYTVAEEFSVSMWVYSYGKNSFDDNENDQVLWAREEIAGKDRIILGGFDIIGGSLHPRFRVRRNDTSETSVTILSEPLSIKTWHMLTFIYRGYGIYGQHDIKLYVDGVLPADGAKTSWFNGGSNLYMSSPLSIGWFPPAITEKYPFNGKMDEVLFFDKALTEPEILDIYQDGLNGKSHCKPGNHAPLFTNVFPATTEEDELFSVTVTHNDIDGDPVTLSDSVLPGWLSLNPGTGLLQGTPTNDDLGLNTVILKITDGTVAISKTISIMVNNANDAPIITSLPGTSVDEDVLYEYLVEYSDSDPGDVLTLTADAPAWLILNSNTLSGTPTNAVLGTEPYVDFDIKIKVTDLAGDSAVQNYVLRVDNVNDAPTILGQNAVSTPGNAAIQLDLETVFDATHIVDVDDEFPADFVLTIQSGTDYLLGANNTITPVAGFRGDLSVSATITDKSGTGASVPYVITVSVNNNEPVITSSPITTKALDGTPYVYNITAEDPDLDDDLVYSADVIPGWLGFDSGTQILTGTPTEVGNYSVSLSVTDGTATATQSFAISVVITGIEDHNESGLRLYPIPADDRLFIEFTKSFNSGLLEIMDIKGNIVLQKELNSFEDKLFIDVTEYSAGIYIYKVTFDSNSYTGKILVK